MTKVRGRAIPQHTENLSEKSLIILHSIQGRKKSVLHNRNSREKSQITASSFSFKDITNLPTFSRANGNFFLLPLTGDHGHISPPSRNTEIHL